MRYPTPYLLHYVIHPNKLHSLPHVPLFSAGPPAKTLLGKLERQSARNRILVPLLPFFPLTLLNSFIPPSSPARPYRSQSSFASIVSCR